MSSTEEIRHITFSPPDVGEKEADETRDTILSGWITTGPRTKELENKVAQWIGVEKAACLNSQTACAETALRLLGIGVASGGSADDEVITCAYTYTASASVIDHVGAKIVLVDCQKDSFLIDYDVVEKAITSKTKVIVVAHLYGTPGKIDEIKEIADRHGALIVEDAAESLGAKYRGNVTDNKWQETGTFGNYNCISFNGNKIITGSAGGMFLTDSKEDADKVRKWSTQSREAALWYQHEELGYNYRMNRHWRMKLRFSEVRL